MRVASLEHVVLSCSVCGREAVTLSVGEGGFGEGRSLNYRGICHGQAWPLRHAPDLLALAQLDQLAELHRQIQARGLCEEGIDAYCPDCDAIYCATHYPGEVVWEDGFYDCTWGTCPAGHRRMIDD